MAQHRAPLVLDLGCGEGRLPEKIGHISRYHGVDISERYIEYAKSHYGVFGSFAVLDIAHDFSTLVATRPDFILMVGVLHHIDDRSISEINKAIDVKHGDSISVSLDGVFLQRQRFLARLLLALDRGRFIRSLEAYERLMPKREFIVPNFNRIPFDHVLFYRNMDVKTRFEEFRGT
jgi:SAM-dependent methyltransferase